MSSISSSSVSSPSSLVAVTTSPSFSSSFSTSSQITSLSPSSTVGILNTVTVVATATATATNLNPSGTSKSHLSPGKIAGLVIGGLFAGFVVGGCILFVLLVVRRRLRQRKSAVRTQPEERLMHLERMRGEMAPPLREGSAIQSLPPSRNIRVLNWLARTRNAGPPSVTQHTMSERSRSRSTREDHRSAASVPLPVSISDSNTSQSHYSQPSLEPQRSEPQGSSSTVVRHNRLESQPQLVAAGDNELDSGRRS